MHKKCLQDQRRAAGVGHMSRWHGRRKSAYSQPLRRKYQNDSAAVDFSRAALMRTHSTPANSDTTLSSLDRTDVLPVLDVEAYEATLVENQKTLSRTDTWTVDALQDIDELIESATHEAPVEVRSINVNRDGARKEGVTVNVDRILKRIADLEADIVKAHDANAVMQKRNEALQAERDQHAARIEALTAEQSRLAEHRALAEEMARRSEKQLREEAHRLEER